MEKELPDQQTVKMEGLDYITPGYYFVTICSKEKAPFFGTIINGRRVLNENGKIAEECWRKIPEHFPNVRIDEYVVMPNHVHGIVHLTQGSAIEASCTLGDIIGSYKSAVSHNISRGRQIPVGSGQLPARSRQLPAPLFDDKSCHRNYWNVIVREEKALDSIRNYIRFNPQNYEAVVNCGEPKFLGNADLLLLPKVGFLASRGEVASHGDLPMKKGEAVLSGFLSPMERKLFWSALEHQKPVIWVKPWVLDEGTDRAPIRQAIDQGRLLILSPFSERMDAPSVRRAAWCNQYVLAHCDRMVVGHLNPDGMLSCILTEAHPDLEITYL